MMPDLGTYAVPVLAAYAGGILALVALTAQSLWRARQTKNALHKLEESRRDG